jgi:hypothetical protein
MWQWPGRPSGLLPLGRPTAVAHSGFEPVHGREMRYEKRNTPTKEVPHREREKNAALMWPAAKTWALNEGSESCRSHAPHKRWYIRFGVLLPRALPDAVGRCSQLPFFVDGTWRSQFFLVPR